MERSISFTLNGKPTSMKVDDERMLLWVLRYDLGLTGAKFGCGTAFCGACTVIVDNEAVRSCSVQVKEMAGKNVLTIEGLSKDGHLHPIQEAFVNHNAFQCGYCTPGMIMNAYALLLQTPKTTPPPTSFATWIGICVAAARRFALSKPSRMRPWR